ncbi:MAG: VWA domain-containing protein [Thermoplasmatota archaeon]
MKGSEGIIYPHVKGAGVVLPDCSRGIYRPFKLTAGEKRALIRSIADRGLRGIDDFLESPRERGAVLDRLEQIRKKIQEQLESVLVQRRSRIDDEIKRLTRDESLRGSEVVDGLLDDASAMRRYTSEQIRGEILADELIAVLEGRREFEDYVEKRKWIRRLLDGLKKFFLKIASLFIRFWKWVRSLFTRTSVGRRGNGFQKRRAKGAISLPFPGLEGDLDRWEKDLDRKLEADDNLQKAVNRKLSDRYGYDSGFIEFKSSYDKEWYREKAKEVLREEVAEKAREKEKEMDTLQSEMKRTREELEERRRKRREEVLKLEREMEKEIEDQKQRVEKLSREEVKGELIKTLSHMGYLEKRGPEGALEEAQYQWEITQALVEKFSEFILADLMEKAGGPRDRRGSQVSDAGVYEKARMRMVGEEARMDILQTMVNVRMNHPGDRSIDNFDVIVHREVTTSELHCVIIVDVSGSMEENMRLDAAKRSVLALSQAVKRDNPRNKVDIIKVSTRAAPISLKELLSLEPRGFTNHQEALSMARSILEASRSDRHLLFLITDGLPEAYINENGEPMAGDLDRAMELTLVEAGALLRIPNLAFEIFLLEPRDEAYTTAARRIAKAGDGNLIVADPQELAFRVLGEFMSSDRKLEGI